MKGRIVTFLLMCSFALNIWAQEDTLRIVRDSLRMMQETSGEMLMIPLLFPANEPMNLSLKKTLPSDSSITFHFQKPSLMIPYYTNPSPMFKGDFDTNGILFAHRYGMLMGAGNQKSLPGIGRSNDASLTYIHFLNSRWTFSVGIDVNKMHMSHFTGQSLGASGTLSYQANDRLTVDTIQGMYLVGRIITLEGRLVWRYPNISGWKWGYNVIIIRFVVVGKPYPLPCLISNLIMEQNLVWM